MKPVLFCLALAAGLAGCATPQSRINASPAVYARLTPAQQQLIREGKVALGFDAAMVKLALGDPDRIRERTDASGTTEIWSYVTYEMDDGMPLYRGYYHRYNYGFSDPFYPYYLGYPARREYEHFRVVLKDGAVISIERELP